MKEALHYFFGKGTEVEFTNFSLAHFLPILFAIGLILLIGRFRNGLRTFRHEEKLRYTLAFILIISEMAYFWRLVGLSGELNPNALEHLPITVCGWVAVFASYMLIGKNQTLFDVCYFWLFSGSIFALVTPTVITYTGPTRFRYYQFWVQHTFGYVAVFYMIFVHGMRPTIKSAIKAYCGMLVLAVIAYFVNRMLGPGANYLFMAELEETTSVLDILPKNVAVRMVVMGAVVSVMYFVSYLPWLIKDCKKKKAETTTK